MEKTKKIEHIHEQLINKRERINSIKIVLVIILSTITIINLFTLFYYYNQLYIILEISILFLILTLIVSTMCLNILKNRCKKLEYLIYEEQKL